MGKKIEYSNGEMTIYGNLNFASMQVFVLKCYLMYTIPKKGRGYKLKTQPQKS